MVNFQMLVLGLVMICAQTSSESTCPLIQEGKGGAHFLLVNATKDGPDCTRLGCETCGMHVVDHHVPMLVFYDKDKTQARRCQDYAGSYSIQEEIRCLKLEGKKLCVDLPPGSLKMDDTSSEEPSSGEEMYYGWIAPVSLFDPGATQLINNLKPATGNPVIASLEVPDLGHLQAEMVSQGDLHGGKAYTVWGAFGSKKQALAEGALWTTKITGEVKLTDCNGTVIVTISEDYPQLALVNLPGKIFKSKKLGKSKDSLEHFELFYKLIAGNKACGLPRRLKGPKSKLETVELEEWVRRGGDPGMFRTSTATVLCPPSKFP